MTVLFALQHYNPQSCIVCTVKILQSYTMSISTGPVMPLSCTVSIDKHLRYCSLICIMSLIIQIRVQYLTDHIIKLNTVEMKSRAEVDSTCHFVEYLSKSRVHRVCNDQLFGTGKSLLPEFIEIRIWHAIWPTNMVELHTGMRNISRTSF